MENKNKNKKVTKNKTNIKNMGINIDKNEYYEIVLSNSAHPEDTYNKKFKGY